MKSQQKALIVGASGQVGTQMLAALGEHALATSREPREGWLQLDLAELTERSQAATLLEAYSLDAIYCVGGMTYVDGCEAEPEMAWRTNARGPAVLAEFAQQHGVPYVFFSSDYVFDGTADDPGPYAEDDRTNPLSVYGRTKLEGEQRILAANPDALVLRTTWVHGADPREKNFAYTLMRTLTEGKTMRVPTDQISTPTYNRDLIKVALSLVQAKASGIFHVAGPELMSRMEFARRLAEVLGLNAALLEGVPTAALAQPAPRPLASGLSTAKLLRHYPALRLRTLAQSLSDCSPELRQFLERQKG